MIKLENRSTYSRKHGHKIWVKWLRLGPWKQWVVYIKPEIAPYRSFGLYANNTNCPSHVLCCYFFAISINKVPVGFK